MNFKPIAILYFIISILVYGSLQSFYISTAKYCLNFVLVGRDRRYKLQIDYHVTREIRLGIAKSVEETYFS